MSEENSQGTFPVLGQKAPDFEAPTTQGTLRLSDYKGTWLILFSHPADFTPVCTTEFIAFSQIYDDLKKRNVELLGLSVDSVTSHIAWIRNVEEKMGVKIPFPIIADLNKDVSKKFGMIHPGQSKTETVRCVFIIDPESTIRTILYYPLTTGRNMAEILRIVDALQTTDKYKVATPANWKPGEPVVVPPPGTTEQAEERLKEGYECKDWYLCTKSCPRADLMPCVSPDGKPTSTGIITLTSLKGVSLTPEEVAHKTGQPLFRVRSGLRELKNAGFVEEKAGQYVLSQSGEAIIP